MRMGTSLPCELRPRLKTLEPYWLDFAKLACIAAVFVLPVLITGHTILPVYGRGMTPLSAYAYPGPRVPHIYTIDQDAALGSDLGFANYTVASLRAGHIPFWNPYQGLGEPLLAEGGSDVLYPVNLLYLILPHRYWDLPKFLHLFLAACFLYLWAAELGLDRDAALLSGASVFSCGFFQGYLTITTLLAGVTWTPLVLYGMEKAVHRGWRAALVPIAAGAVFLGLGCHPGLGIGCGLMIVAYAAVRRTIVPALPGLLIGTLCSAPAWLTFVRHAIPMEGTLGVTSSVLGAKQFSAVLLPYLYGAIHEANVFGNPALHIVEPWPLSWIPPALTVLALAGFVFSVLRRYWPMLTVGAIALGLLLWAGDVPPFPLLAKLPFLHRVTTAYFMGPIQLCLCILAGRALPPLQRKWLILTPIWAAALIVAILPAAVLYFQNHPGNDPAYLLSGAVPGIAWWILVPVTLAITRRPEIVTLAAVLGSGIAYFPSGAENSVTAFSRNIPVAAFLLVSGFVFFWPKRASAWLPIAVMFVTAILVQASYPGLPTRSDPFEKPDFVGYLQQRSPAWRAYSTEGYLSPDLAAGFSVPTLNLLGNLIPRNELDFMHRFIDPAQNPVQFYGLLSPIPGTDQLPPDPFFENKRYWDYLGMKYFVRDRQSPPPGERYVYESALPDNRAACGHSPKHAPPPPTAYQPAELNQPVNVSVSVEQPVSEIELLVSNYGRSNPGRLSLTLADCSGKQFAHEELDSTLLEANQFLPIMLPNAAPIPPGDYILNVTFSSAFPTAAVGLWIAPATRDYRHLLALRTSDRIAMAYLDRKAGVRIWDNTTAQPMLYVSRQTEAVPDWQTAQDRFALASDLRQTAFVEGASCPSGDADARFSNVRVEPNRVRADVETRAPGTLTLVMNHLPGWSARVNSQPQNVYRVNGAFQGVCLDRPGHHEVVFEYEPPGWRTSLVLAALGVLLFIGLRHNLLRLFEDISRFRPAR